MKDNLLKAQAFKLKGRLYTFTVLELLNTNMDLFEEQLSEVISKAPKLFENSPIVLDCSQLEGETDGVSLESFFKCMRAKGMLPVAIQGASPALSAEAQSQGIALMQASSAQDKSLAEDAQPAQTQAGPLTAASSANATLPHKAYNKMVATPVRSGQQVVSKGGDLIVSAAVSHGAELLADGNIHVYGVLRGRALAGISGDKEARIFCQSLDAELVSIAGFYRLSDAIPPSQEACQIYLKGEHIVIEPIS